jgi:3-hydroxyisobutyrate dehydrogenase-like beta-hydroxyacid dehydrogenase
MRVGFIGFGEAARAFQASLQRAGVVRFATYDILFGSEGPSGPTAVAARAAGVATAPSNRALAQQSDWVFSAVTASSSLSAAEETAPHLSASHVFIDINSVSPERKRQAERLVTRNGALYLDMAVMAPVHPAGHRTPVLVAGSPSAEVSEALLRYDFCFEHVGAEVGQATAIKMVRSLFVKGLESLTVELLLAARRSGCWDRVLHSLSTSYPGLDWGRFPSYQLERVTRHGIRRAAEMRESAATLEELGMSGALARAVADTQERLGERGFRVGDADPAAEVDRLLAEMLADRG